MTEIGKIMYPVVFSVIHTEYNKIVKAVRKAKITLKNAEAKKKNLVDAMRELGYDVKTQRNREIDED